MKTIHTLPEFYAMIGGKDFYSCYRAIYKATPCGPWICSLVEKSPTFSASITVAIGLGENRQPRVVFREEGYHERDMAQAEDLSLLGFCPRGFAKSGIRSLSLKKYRAKVEDFARKQRNPGVTVTVHHGHPHSGERDRRRVWVTISRAIPADRATVMYDAKEEEHAGACGIQIGSIVEGSDAEIGPESLMFPFTDEEFDAVVSRINEEASQEWEEANAA